MPSKIPTVIAVDTNFLVSAVTKKATSQTEQRAAHLIERVGKNKSQVVIPMPALAEYLVRANSASLLLLQALEGKSCIRTAPFDRAAAVECSQMDAAALGRGDKRDGQADPWPKVKVDRQIVAIAKAVGAGLIISDDSDVRAIALRAGIPTMRLAELTLPVTQGSLRLVKSGASTKAP